MQGNLLDDTELIGVLAVTKATAAQVNAKLAGASEARRRIGEACEEYRPVAHRAQIVYFLIAQFSTVSCMYQTSLAQARQLGASLYRAFPFLIHCRSKGNFQNGSRGSRQGRVCIEECSWPSPVYARHL